jgi:hypothetical protein
MFTTFEQIDCAVKWRCFSDIVRFVLQTDRSSVNGCLHIYALKKLGRIDVDLSSLVLDDRDFEIMLWNATSLTSIEKAFGRSRIKETILRWIAVELEYRKKEKYLPRFLFTISSLVLEKRIGIFLDFIESKMLRRLADRCRHSRVR